MPRAGLTTEKVVLAGAELSDEIGFAGLTASELARRLGVRTASLYSHVDGTDDLRKRVALLALAELADRGSDAVAGRSGHDALVALGDTYRGYAAEHPGRYDATRLRLDAQTAAASAGPRHAQLARAVLRGYRLSPDDETHAVRLLGTVFHGFTTLELSGGFAHSTPDSLASWTRILDGLHHLLDHWSTP